MIPSLALLAALAAPPSPPTLAKVLAETPADSLAAPLRRLEQQMGRSQEAGEVALALGEFHFARGEYRQAVETLGRAAARLDPARKSEARYWQGLAQLGLQQFTEARVTLEEVARASLARRAEAQLGIAAAWEQAGRPDRAVETLEPLLESGAGEAAPAALERLAISAARLGRQNVARRAADRLRREYPGSVEAARVRLAAAGAADGARVTLRLGAFVESAEARRLADRARKAGISGVQVVESGHGSDHRWVVRFGSWTRREEAEREASRLEPALGVRPVVEETR